MTKGISGDCPDQEIQKVLKMGPKLSQAKEKGRLLDELRVEETLTETGSLAQCPKPPLLTATEKEKTTLEGICIEYTASNKNRKEAYRLNKKVLMENGNYYFVKTAESADAKRFIDEIKKREESASRSFGDLAIVVRGESRGERLYYPYLKHSSLEENVKRGLSEDSSLMGKSEIERYINFVKRIPQVQVIPKEFYQKFNIKPFVRKELPSTKFGCIDCIPCNILVNGNEWYIIDNEWFFEFPVPMDFLIFRGMSSLIVNLQEEILKIMLRGRACTLFSGYGSKRNYIPIAWLDLFENIEMSLQMLSEWNMRFQREVLYGAKKYRIRLGREPKPCKDNLTQIGEEKNTLMARYYKFKFNVKEIKSFFTEEVGKFIDHNILK